MDGRHILLGWEPWGVMAVLTQGRICATGTGALVLREP